MAPETTSRPSTTSTPPESVRWQANPACRSTRAVYLVSCAGSRLTQAWLAIGARTSAGSHENNYLPEPTTYFFFSAWKQGQTFESGVTGAYRRTIDAMNGVLRAIVTG